MTVRSEAGSDVTTLDAGTGHAVQWVSGEGPNSVLDGFTVISNGAAAISVRNGTSPVIRNCVVTNVMFAGMEVETAARPLVEDCVFRDCGERGIWANFGSPTVVRTDFIENNDGGLFINWGGALVITCRFIGNAASTPGGGGGIRMISADVTVVNCLFAGNGTEEASSFGGALMIEASSPLIANCTLVGNEGFGGAMFCHNLATPVVVGCIIRDNYISQIFDDLAITTVLYTNIEDGWLGLGGQNVDADALFVNPVNSDYRLQPGSPCIDAGHNNAIAGLAVADLDGNPRFADGPAADTGCGVPVIVDMGAYEFQGKPFPVKLGDIDGDGSVHVTDFLTLLGDWGPCSEECCLSDLDLDGEVGVTDFLLLLGNWG